MMPWGWWLLMAAIAAAAVFYMPEPLPEMLRAP